MADERTQEQTSQQQPQMGTYDASSPTPYIAPQAPPLPQIEAPPQRVPESTQQPQKPGAMGGGAKGVVGGIAYMADSILKGYMRGKDEFAQKQAFQLKKRYDAQRMLYDEAGQNYVSLIASGTKPDSQEAKDALNKVRAAKLALMQTYQASIGGEQKKSKGKKGQDQPQDPIAMARSNDPQEKAQGLLAIFGKVDRYEIEARNILAQANYDPNAKKLEQSQASWKKIVDHYGGEDKVPESVKDQFQSAYGIKPTPTGKWEKSPGAIPEKQADGTWAIREQNSITGSQRMSPTSEPVKKVSAFQEKLNQEVLDYKTSHPGMTDEQAKATVQRRHDEERELHRKQMSANLLHIREYTAKLQEGRAAPGKPNQLQYRAAHDALALAQREVQSGLDMMGSTEAEQDKFATMSQEDRVNRVLDSMGGAGTAGTVREVVNSSLEGLTPPKGGGSSKPQTPAKAGGGAKAEAGHTGYINVNGKRTHVKITGVDEKTGKFTYDVIP